MEEITEIKCLKCGHVLMRAAGGGMINIRGAIKIDCLKCKKEKEDKLTLLPETLTNKQTSES